MALVSDIVSSKHASSLVLSSRVPLGKLGTFFDTNSKDRSDMHSDALRLGLGFHARPFSNAFLVPSAKIAESRPFFVHGCLCFWIVFDFFRPNCSCHVRQTFESIGVAKLFSMRPDAIARQHGHAWHDLRGCSFHGSASCDFSLRLRTDLRGLLFFGRHEGPYLGPNALWSSASFAVLSRDSPVFALVALRDAIRIQHLISDPLSSNIFWLCGLSLFGFRFRRSFWLLRGRGRL